MVLWGHRAIGLLRLEQSSKPIESNHSPTLLSLLWGLVGLYGDLWDCMDSYGDVWDAMGSCGVLWDRSPIELLRLDQSSKAIGFNYNPTALPSLWGPVGLFGVLWGSMGSSGDVWGLMGMYGVL